ncbi:serine/threonine-protein kinase [Streptomyces sp. DT20]|uniref:serine/threonine-protein kinase n=1 Tax=Streptomyces sp. DT20 TaxID=3416519 RepID=UPI003CE8BA63
MRYGADGAGLPEHIGGYAVERELGAGGMGTVYLARSRGGRAVAVKVARPELASDPHFRERFRAEVAAARSVGGFHTAPVVDADPAAEAPWLATAYVPGPTLAGLLDAEGPMDEARLRLLGAALAEALEAIHRCGLVHRDLKPGNIIMASDGPRVLDFGIARALEAPRLTATGMAFGTPGFLAPEQAQGQEVGPAADVFALGAVLVAAAGGSAFGAGTPMGMMYRSVHEQPDLRAVPDGLRPVVASCLAKSPDQRPTLGHLLDLIAPATARYSPTVAIPPPPSHAPSIPVPVYQAPAGYGNGIGNGYGNGNGGGVPPVDDPVFLAVAPDSALMVDGMGVTIDFRYRSLQFGWEEIRTVQYAPEGPKHLRVVVHLHDGTAHPCLLAARRRSRLKAWLIDLPMILACFT